MSNVYNVAPFGFHDDLDLIYKSDEQASELAAMKLAFQQWEEVFSRHIFEKHQITDDQIAASFHQFLEVDKDANVSISPTVALCYDILYIETLLMGFIAFT